MTPSQIADRGHRVTAKSVDALRFQLTDHRAAGERLHNDQMMHLVERQLVCEICQPRLHSLSQRKGTASVALCHVAFQYALRPGLRLFRSADRSWSVTI
jgi:hypothetical protein